MTSPTRRAPALSLILAAVAALAVTAPEVRAATETCTREEFAAAVDTAGGALRTLNSETAPKVQARIKELQHKRGWSDTDIEQRAIDYLHSPKIAELDENANKLLTRIDELGDVPTAGPPDCAKLDELKSVGEQLLGIVRAKSQLTLASIDAAIAEDRQPAAERPAERKPAEVERQPTPPTPPAAVAHKPAPKADAAKGNAAPPATSKPWQTATSPVAESARSSEPPASLAAPGAAGPSPAAALPLPPIETTDSPNGYSIDEIHLATRGFFGTISTNLGSVIEYAFSKFGRPAGYVLGTEGGGAFLAGVRYGKGELYMRSGARQQVYWHGPSVGYDFGAEGSRTLFLVYHVESPEQMFRTYAGIDGSAYLVGGVGLTVLKGGPVIMAPIRTGLGLRLGANIGYLRFTPKATWNPF